MAKGFSDIKPRSNDNKPRIDELVEVLDLSKRDKKWINLRFLPADVLPHAMHWIEIIGSKSKEKVTIPKTCVGFNMETEDHKKEDCPYCEQNIRLAVSYYANAIVRVEQEKSPNDYEDSYTKAEKKTGFKDKDSSSWTPVRVVRLPSSLAQKLQGLRDLNVHKGKNGQKTTYDITDEKYGADVNIKYDKNGTGADKYQVQLADKTALTEEELKYLIWELTPALVHVESYDEAKAELSRMTRVDEKGNKIKNTDDGAKRRKGRDADADEDDDEDEDDDIDIDDDEDEEDEKPKKKSKVKEKPKGKSKKVEEDDLDIDEDEDEEDEKPKKKAKSKKVEEDDLDLDDDEDEKPKKAKSKKVEEDDEDDLELEDDEDEKPKKKPKSKKVEDDDLDLDEDEDEKPKKKNKAKAKPTDEDDDEDDYDLEDDEDIVPPTTKKKK